jgi:hypothetical protein
MPSGVSQQLVETGTFRLCSGNRVRVLTHDFVSALLCHFAQIVKLRFHVLIAR